MSDIQIAIKTLAQQWSIEAKDTTSERARRDLERQIFALELLCVRLGFETLEVDLELARESINGPLGAA